MCTHNTRIISLFPPPPSQLAKPSHTPGIQFVAKPYKDTPMTSLKFLTIAKLGILQTAGARVLVLVIQYHTLKLVITPKHSVTVGQSGNMRKTMRVWKLP